MIRCSVVSWLTIVLDLDLIIHKRSSSLRSPYPPGYRISYNYFRSLVPDPFLSAMLLIRYRNSDGNHYGHFHKCRMSYRP